MDIGLFVPFANPIASAEYCASVARAAEERGFASLWVAEHVVLFDEYDSRYPYDDTGKIPIGGEAGVLEPFTTLAFLANATSRIRLGTGICLLPQRNPVYTAKEATTVDWLSNGRLDLGIGVGWLAEEFRAVAAPWADRGARCNEYIEVMRALWCEKVSEHHGEYYDLPACRQYPKPVQKPHPPIHVGGESDAALARVATLAQGWYGFDLEPDALTERLALLDRLLSDRGRARSDVRVSVCPYRRPVDLDLVKRYRDEGVDQVIVLAGGADIASATAALDRIAGGVVEPAASL